MKSKYTYLIVAGPFSIDTAIKLTFNSVQKDEDADFELLSIRSSKSEAKFFKNNDVFLWSQDKLSEFQGTCTWYRFFKEDFSRKWTDGRGRSVERIRMQFQSEEAIIGVVDQRYFGVDQLQS